MDNYSILDLWLGVVDLITFTFEDYYITIFMDDQLMRITYIRRPISSKVFPFEVFQIPDTIEELYDMIDPYLSSDT